MNAVLQTRGLGVSLGVGAARVQALAEIDLNLPGPGWTAIVGPNGAGKSSLLRALAGLLPFQGTVLLHGRSLMQLRPRERACAVSWLGQNEAAADDLLVHDVAMLGRLPHLPWLGAPSAADYAIVENALRAVHVWDLRARALGQISGGERQRVLLARALAVQAQVLLMDEPLANLDPPHQADWLAQVRVLAASGATVVSALHELSLALRADALVILRAGAVVHHGNCAEPATHRALEQVFDGRVRVHAVDGRWVALPE